MKRNPNQLYQWYIQRLHDNPNDRPNIPTTNRATVYDWAKEDRWDERVKLEEIEILDKSAATYADMRMRGYDMMNGMIILAVNELEKLVKSATDQKVKLQAINTLLDRVGMGADKSQQNRHVVGTPTDTPLKEEAPDLDADEESLLLYLSTQSREG